LADFRPDVVHVLLFHAAAVLATLPRAGGGVRVATNVYGEAVQHLAHARLREPIDRWAGRHVDHTIAISEAVERFLIGHYGYRSTSVSCIPLGWEGHPLPRGAEPRPPTIVSVAKLRPEKGHVVLVAAFQEVARQLPDARLVLVGDGPLRASLEQQIEARGLTSSVVITGSVPDVWTYLADADVFALASTTEAYGIAVAEAMAAGLPVVASAVGGIPELVVPAVTGQLFSPGDSSALASHLVTILRSSDRGAAMGAAGREAAEPHRLSRSAARYADAWERLAARADVRR
jgi:glycosyltransferase involved in cell wall biosynthesis